MDGAPLPPPPPARQLDTVAVEGLDDVVDAVCPDRRKVKSRDFPELLGLDVRSADVEIVLYDYNSVDSFAAAYAARAALGRDVIYYGVNRNSIVEDLTIEVTGRVVAMLGFCWPLDVMHDLVIECRWLFILDNHVSIARELEQFTYPQAVPVIDLEMGAGALAWNFFHPTGHVPALYRALEDAELGRKVLRDAELFSIGFEAAFDLAPPCGEVDADDVALERIKELLGDDGGRLSICEAVEQGRDLEPGLRVQCNEAAAHRVVATMRAFPAWRCAMANVSSPLAGKIAESLVEEFVASSSSACPVTAAAQAEDGGNPANRCFSAVFEVKRRHVRVVLRSSPDGPDVSEIAALYEGCGHWTRAFFSVESDLWDALWVQPEPVLWDVKARGPCCLNLSRGETVTVARRGERFRDSPFDEWSWGYSNGYAAMEGWIPTLAHTLLVATQSVPAPGPGVSGLEEGDMIVAKGQRGNYLWGRRYKVNAAGTAPGWYSKADEVLQPVHASTTRAMLARGEI